MSKEASDKNSSIGHVIAAVGVVITAVALCLQFCPRNLTKLERSGNVKQYSSEPSCEQKRCDRYFIKIRNVGQLPAKEVKVFASYGGKDAKVYLDPKSIDGDPFAILNKSNNSISVQFSGDLAPASIFEIHIGEIIANADSPSSLPQLNVRVTASNASDGEIEWSLIRVN